MSASKIKIDSKKDRMTLYVRIDPENRKWVSKKAKDKNMSDAEFMNLLIETLRLTNNVA